jgi:beta-N-acetylhexosaminidase
MTAHVELPAIEPTPGLPATLSANVLQTLLRDKIGFQGLIMTDSLGMGALDQTYGVTQATVLAFQAGADILAFGADPGHTPAEQRPAYQQVLTLVQSGAIPRSRLDESVRRILLTKGRYGLLDWQPANLADIPQRVGTNEHLTIARRIAQRSIGFGNLASRGRESSWCATSLFE